MDRGDVRDGEERGWGRSSYGEVDFRYLLYGCVEFI